MSETNCILTDLQKSANIENFTYKYIDILQNPGKSSHLPLVFSWFLIQFWVSKLRGYKGLRHSWKLCRHLCSLRWLRPNLSQVRNVKPFGSKILYMLVWTGRIKENDLLLNTEIDSEFFMLRPKSNQSFRVEGKRVLETIC